MITLFAMKMEMKLEKFTSGTQSPSLEKAIGLGYVKTAFSKIDAFIYIKVREKNAKS
jgi:aminomethyltransferase